MRFYDYLVPNVNFFGPGCLEVVGQSVSVAACFLAFRQTLKIPM